MDTAAARFNAHFLSELKASGYPPAQARQFIWRPTAPEQLAVTGVNRDHNLQRLAFEDAEFHAQWQATPPAPKEAAEGLFANTVLVLMPGFTHETLRYLSWHEQINRRDSPHEVRVVSPGWQGEAPKEQLKSSGPGLKLLYLRYPRSNAASAHVLPGIFELLSRCVSLQKWVKEEGRKVIFVGYSYGAPLSLELLAGLHSGRFNAPWLLQASQAFLSLCGDIGGSYLADDVLSEKPQLLNLAKALAYCQRHPFVAKLAGLGTPQLMEDIRGGVQSLGHADRQAAIREYAPLLPAHLLYFSVAAVMPLADYRRKFWQFNVDDYTMYRQALVSDPISVYNDGQVVLTDNLIPDAAHLPAAQRIHLGQVRTHHWGVSYKTFNWGHNRFPRVAFYRALLRSVSEALDAKP